MPAVSQAQRTAMAIAEHNPGKLYDKDKGLLKMTHGQLHDYAATPSQDLPARTPGGLARRALLHGMASSAPKY